MKTCDKCKFCIGCSIKETIKVVCKLHKDKVGINACEDYKHYGFDVIKDQLVKVNTF